ECQSLVVQPRQCPTLFPYTTLFRSRRAAVKATSIKPALAGAGLAPAPKMLGEDGASHTELEMDASQPGADGEGADALDRGASDRSEEHTSELQSRFDLVCRLLLEKK